MVLGEYGGVLCGDFLCLYNIILFFLRIELE